VTLPDAAHIDRVVGRMARRHWPILRRYHSRHHALILLRSRLDRMYGRRAPAHRRDLPTFTTAWQRLELCIGV
jgi:hypothetical protein